MTLRARFVIVLFMFWVAVCLNIYAATYYSHFLLRRAASVLETNVPIQVTLEAAQKAVQRQHAAVVQSLKDGAMTATLQQQIEERYAEITSYTDRLDEPGLDASLTAAVSALRRHLQDHERSVFGYLAGAATADATSRPETFAVSYDDDYDALQAQFHGVLEALFLAQRRGARNIHASADQVNRVLFGMACAELVILIVTLSFFSHWILKPIAAIRAATEQIAAGNLDYRLVHHKHDELGALANEINSMAASLSVAQRELKQKERMAATGEMVSVVAHNIRNPLAGIRATAQTTMHQFDPDSSAHHQQQRIITSVDSLEQWLKELLHLNRSIDLNLEPTSIDDIVADLQHIFQPTMQRRNITINYRPERPQQVIEVDSRHFVQAMASILDNAIEATPADSAVQIQTGVDETARKMFFIEIADAGAGVPPKLRQQIFEPYFSTKPGGTGIGLSMAKKIIEAHSGRLSLHDGSPQTPAGAVFRLEIPFAQVRTKGADHHGQSHPG